MSNKSTGHLCNILLLLAFFFFPVPEAGAELMPGDWRPEVRQRLQSLLEKHKNKNEFVVFDLDNTIICRDIGEATFAQLINDRRLTTKSIPRDISPNFVNPDGKRYTIKRGLINYYDGLLESTKENSREREPYANGYAWVVQIMRGLTPWEVVDATDRAFAKGVARQDRKSNSISKINGIARPFFYPEMVDLLGNLLAYDYEVYVISASNVWTVRRMVLAYLNPAIQKATGKKLGIKPENVRGVSLLLQERKSKHLAKDPLLVVDSKAYANMNQKALNKYRLTAQLNYPLTGYFGKLAVIHQLRGGQQPLLIAGDSPNDHPMMASAKYKLWLARLEKTGYQAKLAKLAGQDRSSWIVQPTFYKTNPGFVASSDSLKRQTSKNSTRKAQKSISILKKSGLLADFP